MTDHKLQPCPWCGRKCEYDTCEETGEILQSIACTGCDYVAPSEDAHKFICDCVALVGELAIERIENTPQEYDLYIDAARRIIAAKEAGDEQA